MTTLAKEADPLTGITWWWVQGPWTAEVEARLLKEKADSLFLNHTRGWTGDDMAFLARLPELRRFSLIAWEVEDVSGVGSAAGLEYLLLQATTRSRVGFESLTKLRHCVFKWIPGNEAVFRCQTLEHLSLLEYKVASLEPLRGLPGLASLKLSDNRKAADTAFLSGLPKLKSLQFGHYRALSSLDGLLGVPGLEILKVSGSRKIASLDPIGGLTRLHTLELQGLGQVPSLQFLSACRNLREIQFIDTEVEDGKLDFLDALPNLERAIFENMRHYNRKREDYRGRSASVADALNQEILADHIKKRLGGLSG